MATRTLLPLLLLAATAPAAAPKKVTFPSLDGLEITADLYLAHKDVKRPFLVLFHQAGWSRGEYREIAPKLNELGYNCMAVDQRSGREVNGVANETAKRAAEAGKGTTYLDARQDVVAALRWARKHHAKGKLLAWGSSYSAALVLEVAGREKDIADGVLSFAPGEYFTRLGKPDDWIQQAAKKITLPVFITSARKEHPNWKAIFDAIPSEKKTAFIPETAGNHGSRALWKRFPDHQAYWDAVEAFLKKHFPPKS